jgi:hypothetical protein
MRANSARSAKRFAAEIDGHPLSSVESQPANGVEGGAIGQLVSRALSLRPRGAIGNDGLVVRNLSARLRVQLLARPIHPWDRHLPANERSELFVQQCLEDVSIAIPKLFHSMPEVDEMELTVLDPRSKSAIISGIVKRGDTLDADRCASAGMKLRAMGLIYGRNNFGFEGMNDNPVLVLNPLERASRDSAFTE